MSLNLDTIKTVDTQPFRYLVSTIGNLPTSFTDSMSYYELLAWFLKFLEEQVIPTVNNNAAAVEELQQLFIQLHDYVENYFANLDVQEEINNKLDEMAAEGTLQEIITSYIQANVAWTFDTVADMKLATNLVNGSYAQTLGFYSINDGGGAIYHISDSGTADEMQIISVDNLYANLTNPKNVKQFGAKGDGVQDDTPNIQLALNTVSDCILNIGNYRTTDTLVIPKSHTLRGENKESCKIIYYGINTAVALDGRYSVIKSLSITADNSVSSTSKIGVAVRPDIAPSSDTTITNNLIEDIVFRNFYKSISLDNMWQVTIRNCVIIGVSKGSEGNRNCYGISYEASGSILAHWSGSGNIIQSCYITNCSYALHIQGGWDISIIDSIIEHNYSSIYRDLHGRNVIFINTWFEANEARPDIASPIMLIGCRKNVLSGTSDLEFPDDMNNAIYLDDRGIIYNKNGQCISSNTLEKEATLTGVKSLVPASITDPINITSLKAYTSKGNIIPASGYISDNNLTGELSIVAYGTAGGNGKTYTGLQYRSGQTNGNEADIAIRPVFLIDKDGGITNPNGTEATDIGSSAHKYKFGWFKNVIVKGDNGNYYKIGVDTSGNVKASQL